MKSDLGHKDVTQPYSENVHNTIRRNGTYHYRRRIPTDLVKVAAFGFKKNSSSPQDFIRYSLHTKEPQEARRRVAIENAKAEEDFERFRQNIQCADGEAVIRCINDAEPIKRKLGSLSAPERRDFIFCLFIELERRTLEANGRDLSQISSEDLKERRQDRGDDLAALAGNSSTFAPVDWKSILSTRLERHGIMVNDENSREFLEMQDMIKRAHVENAWRSSQALEGRPHEQSDSLFAGMDGRSDFPNYSPSKPKTIAELCSSYLEVSETRLSLGTVYKHKQMCGMVKEFFGKDTAVNTISIEKATELVRFIAKIPVNCTKRYENLSFGDASRREAKKEMPQFIATKTQRDTFEGVKAIFNYAFEMEWIKANPFGKKVLSNMIQKVESKSPPPPTSEDLNTLFSAKKYLNERGRNNAGDARFWVPLLCLFHGFRANEVCQLLVSDIQRHDGIDFIHLREQDDAGNFVKQLKTTSSQRKVPLHKEVLEMGFLDLVQAQKHQKEKQLFPSLKKSKKGSMADGVGKWFGRIKQQLFREIPPIRGAKGLHSLRHAFVRGCRDAEVELPLRWALGGWSGGGKNSESEYGDGYSMSTLKQAIDKVQYSDVDLTSLYPSATKAVRKRSR